MTEPATRVVETTRPVDLAATLRLLAVGAKDPSMRITAHDGVWRATRTPKGPATLHLVDAREPGAVGPTQLVAAEASGPGADWVLERVPALIGDTGDRPPFEPTAEPVRRLHHRAPGLLFPRTDNVIEALAPTVLGQRVTALEALRSWRQLQRGFGRPAPGPPGLLLRPDPAKLARMNTTLLHAFGVEARRAMTLMTVCHHAVELDRLVDRDPDTDELRRALETLPGVGPWTSATVVQQTLGDPDVVITGDFHLPHLVAWNLAGEERGTDERMLELLEPYRGYRGHVVRLLGRRARRAPARGPRQRLRSITSM